MFTTPIKSYLKTIRLGPDNGLSQKFLVDKSPLFEQLYNNSFQTITPF